MNFESWYKKTFALATLRSRNISTDMLPELIEIAYEEIMINCNMYMSWTRFVYDERTVQGTLSYRPTTTDIQIDSYHIGEVKAVVDSCGERVLDYEFNRNNCCINHIAQCEDIYVCRVAVPPMEACDLDVLLKIRKTIADYVAMTLFESTASTKGSSRFEFAERAYYKGLQDLKDSVPDHIWTDNITQNNIGVVKNG